MATSFINSATSYSTGSVSTIACNKPTNTADNDIMFAVVYRKANVDPSTVPAGWTLLADSDLGYGRWAYWKVAASEGASYTWEWAASTETAVAIGTWRGGFNTFNPIDNYSNTQYLTEDTTIRAATINVTYANSIILFLGSAYSATSLTCTAPTNPGTFTEDVDTGSTAPDSWFYFYHYEWSGTGATGSIDGTLSATVSSGKHAFAVSLQPIITLTLTPTGDTETVSTGTVDMKETTYFDPTGAVETISTSEVELKEITYFTPSGVGVSAEGGSVILVENVLLTPSGVTTTATGGTVDFDLDTNINATTYRTLIERGGCRVAYVWNVSGYPWAVCSDPSLITLLSSPETDSDAAYVRKRIFGNVLCKDTYPAYDALVFPTLDPNLGIQKTKCESVGFMSLSSWSIKILDSDLGATWPHISEGDEIFGIEGIHRVSIPQDSGIAGWGFIDGNLSVEGNALSVSEQSSNIAGLFSRIDSLTGNDFKYLWIGHECMASDGIKSAGTYPDYDLNLCARGLFRSMPQYHFVDAIEQVHQIVADVPGSIAGHYCWLWAIPLTDDGQFYFKHDNTPIVALESSRCGIVSEDIVTDEGITTVTINPCLDALKNKISYDVTESITGHISKYVFCRGNSGTDWDDIFLKGQRPHLYIAEYEINTLPGNLTDNGYWNFKPVWLCAKNSVVVFDTLEELAIAVNNELSKLNLYYLSSGVSGTDQYTGDGSTDNEYIGLNYSYSVNRETDYSLMIVDESVAMSDTAYINPMWYLSQKTGGGNWKSICNESSSGKPAYGKWSMVGGVVQICLGLGIPHHVEMYKVPDVYTNQNNSFFDCAQINENLNSLMTPSHGDQGTFWDWRVYGRVVDNSVWVPGVSDEAFQFWDCSTSNPMKPHLFMVHAGLNQREEIMELIKNVPAENFFCAKYFIQWDWINYPLTYFDPDFGLEFISPETISVGNTLRLSRDPDYTTLTFWVENTNPEQFTEGETMKIGQYNATVDYFVSAGLNDNYLSIDSSNKHALVSTAQVGSVGIGSCLICIPAYSIANDSSSMNEKGTTESQTSASEISTDYIHDEDDPFVIKIYRQVTANNVTDVIRAFLGWPNQDVSLPAHEIRYFIPFFTDNTEREMYSFIKWGEFEGLTTGICDFASPIIPVESFVMKDAIDSQMKFYGLGMYEKWNDVNEQMEYGFRRYGNVVTSSIITNNRIVSETELIPESVSEDHLILPVFNKINVDYKYKTSGILIKQRNKKENKTIPIVYEDGKINIINQDVFSVCDRAILELKINLMMELLLTPSELEDKVKQHLVPIIYVLGKKKVTQNRTAIYSSRFKTTAGMETILSDPAAHNPATHRPALVSTSVLITEQDVDLSKNIIKLSYLVGNESGVHGYAPTCRVLVDSVETFSGGFNCTPDEHYSTTFCDDLMLFDCMDISDPTEPSYRIDSCGNYAVLIYACDSAVSADNPLPGTCEIINDGTWRLKIYCDETKLPSTGNLLITFAAFDSDETDQKVWLFFADSGGIGVESRLGDVWR